MCEGSGNSVQSLSRLLVHNGASATVSVTRVPCITAEMEGGRGGKGGGGRNIVLFYNGGARSDCKSHTCATPEGVVGKCR